VSLLAGLVRLDATPTPLPTSVLPRELDPAVVTPGIVGLIFFIALFVALVVLLRSFTRQLKKIDIPGEDDATGEPATAEVEPGKD
jgi:hypothetical protein